MLCLSSVTVFWNTLDMEEFYSDRSTSSTDLVMDTNPPDPQLGGSAVTCAAPVGPCTGACTMGVSMYLGTLMFLVLVSCMPMAAQVWPLPTWLRRMVSGHFPSLLGLGCL